MVGGYTTDALAGIQRRYFKRYLINLAHSEEPMVEWLSMVDNDVPDAEKDGPDIDTLEEEEYTAMMKQLEERRVLLMFRKAVKINLCCYQLFAYLCLGLANQTLACISTHKGSRH